MRTKRGTGRSQRLLNHAVVAPHLGVNIDVRSNFSIVEEKKGTRAGPRHRSFRGRVARRG
jgi:hypothetical protein